MFRRIQSHLKSWRISLCGNKTGTMDVQQNQLSVDIQSLSRFTCTQTRGRTGMEVNPLVFETSASTDSAIWATCFLYGFFRNLQYFS